MVPGNRSLKQTQMSCDRNQVSQWYLSRLLYTAISTFFISPANVTALLLTSHAQPLGYEKMDPDVDIMRAVLQLS